MSKDCIPGAWLSLKIPTIRGIITTPPQRPTSPPKIPAISPIKN
jgi:hypothetical protein